MTANLVLYNGNIRTLDENNPLTTAVAIRDDTILAAGSDQEMRQLLSPNGQEVDLQGATVTPGLVDAHVHFRWFAQSLQQVDVYEVSSLAKALERVAAKAAQKPAGDWLTGRGWKHELWADPSFPTATDLDQVAPNHPVFLSDKSGHAGLSLIHI